MTEAANGRAAKPATAARIYDFQLGGTHNFPADREAAETMNKMFSLVPAMSRANRAFLGRAVRYVAGQGIRQFLDIGSGIPTQGNVHEVAQAVNPDARVVYVDIDPVAVAEGLEILEGNDRATSVWGDLRDPQPILDNPEVRRVLDFDQPIALLLVAVLHFVPDDAAYDSVSRLIGALAPGSRLVLAHACLDERDYDQGNLEKGKDVYRQRTATPLHVRTRQQVERFFDGHELVEPGLTWAPAWRPEPTDPTDFVNDPSQANALVAVARIK